jgi:hypothetical protein
MDIRILMAGAALGATLAGSAHALSGRMVDKAGKPVAGVSAALEGRNLSTVTDAQGRFDFPTVAVAPAGPGIASAPGDPLRGARVDGRWKARRFAPWNDRFAASGGPVNRGAGSIDPRAGVSGDAVPATSPRDRASSAKLAATGDTLACSRSAFLTRRMAVTGSEGDLGDITLYPVVTGTKGTFAGFDSYDFTVAGKSCQLVVPKKPAPGNPWIFKTYFRSHKPFIDSILISHGYFHGFIDLPDMYGAPAAVAFMDQFFAAVTGEYGLSKKPVLLGISRGGLYAYNWAHENLDHVSAIYADAPVMDFVSWPCGCYNTGSGSGGDWTKLKNVYGFSGDAQAKAWPGNPYQGIKAFADAKIPLIHVYGETDTVVPPKENTLRANDTLKAHGWRMMLLPKPNTGHVHGLRDVDGGLPGQLDTLVAFILRNTR